jgi:hypothetical protein
MYTGQYGGYGGGSFGDSGQARGAGMAQGIGSLAAGIGSMFGGNDNNPYDEASKYYNKIPGEIKPYYDPYINAGRGALGRTQQEYGNLLNDPTSMMNKIGAGYHQSPGYQFQMQQGMNGVNNAAGAGGMLGTPAHQFNAASFANGLANQDYYNYMQQGLGQYGMGLNGMQHISDQGYNASNELANSLGSNLMNQGNMAFSGAAANNQSRGQGWGDMIGGAASLLAFL